MVVLPAPFGPMMARISPGSIDQRQRVQRAEAVEGDGDAVEVEERGGLLFGHRPAYSAACGLGAGASAAGGVARRSRDEAGERADDALWQEQRDGDEKPAEHEQPVRGKGA